MFAKGCELLRSEALKKKKKKKICLVLGITAAWLSYVAFLTLGGLTIVSSDFLLFICVFVIVLMIGCLFFALERKR